MNKIIYNSTISFNYGIDSKYVTPFQDFVKKKIDFIYNNNNNSINNTTEYKLDKYFDFNKYKRNTNSEAIIINSDVNYIARAGKFNKDSYSGVLFILKNLLNYEYLWNNIRVNGGAYGVSSTFDKLGYGGFVSYRDPNIKNTDDTYLNIPKYLKSLDIDNKKINNLIISSISSFDNPIATYLSFKRNIEAYYTNIDNDYINKLRNDILESDLIDIKNQQNVINQIIESNQKCGLISIKNIDKINNEFDRIIKINEYK